MRRLRARSGPSKHALKTLAKALQLRGKYLTGSTVVLIGFDGDLSGSAEQARRAICTTLERHGARIRIFSTKGEKYESYRVSLGEMLDGADAAMIDTDSKIFRAVRPKDLRSHGIDIVIATTLRA